MQKKTGSALLAAAMLALASTARARNVLSIESVVVPAGETLVEIPIDLDVDQNLTRLRFDVTFDPAFCNALQDPTDLAVTSDGRNLTDPEDVDYVCSDGVLAVDVLDDTGAIDAGMGLILVLEIGDLKVDAGGAFKFTPRNIRARADTQDVPVTGAAGVLTVTSSSTGPIDGCSSAISFDALGCRLDALIARVEAELGSAMLQEPAFRRLVRAKRAEDKAERLCAGGRTRRTRALLRRAARALVTFRRKLGSLTSTLRLADDEREALGATADGIGSDMRLLREGVACPAASPAGAFLDPIVP